MNPTTRIDVIPDDDLTELLQELSARIERELTPIERIRLFSDGLLQWQGEYLANRQMHWHQQRLLIDDLQLTGTSPAINDIVLNQCQRSPRALRGWIDTHPEHATNLFGAFPKRRGRILVRREANTLRVLNGMHRTLRAIYDEEEYIDAWIGEAIGEASIPTNLPIVYAFARAFRLGHITEPQLIAVLQIARGMYSDSDEVIPRRLQQEPQLIPAINAAFGTAIRLTFKQRIVSLLSRWR